MSPWMIQQDHAAVRTVQLFVVQNLNPLHCLLLGCCLVWMLCMSSCGSRTWAFYSYFLHQCLESGVTGKAFKLLSSTSHLCIPENVFALVRCLCLDYFSEPKVMFCSKYHIYLLTESLLTTKTTWQKVIAEVGLVGAFLATESHTLFFDFHN